MVQTSAAARNWAGLGALALLLLGLAPQLGLAHDNEHNTQQVENAA